MPTSRKCKKCACAGCFLTTLKCFYRTSNRITNEISSQEVLAAMDKAQRLYIYPILGECLTELCAAIELSELDITDPNYVALSAEWQEMEAVIEPLLITATEYVLITSKGFGILTATGYTTAENYQEGVIDQQRKLIEKEIALEKIVLKQWSETNCSRYTCIECSDSGDCEEDDDFELGIEWESTSPYGDYTGTKIHYDW